MMLSADYMILGSGPVAVFLGSELRRMGKGFLLLTGAAKPAEAVAHGLPVLYSCDLHLLSSQAGFVCADTKGKRYRTGCLIVACSEAELSLVGELPHREDSEEHTTVTGLFHVTDLDAARELLAFLAGGGSHADQQLLRDNFQLQPTFYCSGVGIEGARFVASESRPDFFALPPKCH